MISRREEIKGYSSLEELALDFVWSWNRCHEANQIWEQLDAEVWELLHNPWVVLQTVSQEKLERALNDPVFSKKVDELLKSLAVEMKAPAWFQQKHATTPLNCVAYFSMEFMLDESLPIYSGGLGNVAGDQLKAASDLGVPVIGIGLLYQQGYFRQMIDKDGSQHALYPFNDPGQLPITPLRKANGEWLRLEIALPGWSLWLRAWEVKVGRAKLYLLDTNDPVNYPFHRGITSELYGGDRELRLKQELILGIGGWRLLDALGIKPDVCHLNEGHAAFAILERAKCFMKTMDVSFEVALAATRAGNLFTTHTAVPAGFDRFSPSLIEQYLGVYAQDKLGISLETLLALGRQNPKDPNEEFNMAYLAIRGSGSINGVSQLHGKVSRAIFEPLFPRFPQKEVPVGYVTNGVHMPSWGSSNADVLWSELCGKGCWLGLADNKESQIKRASDEKLWKMRSSARKSMIEYARARVAKIWEARGIPAEQVEIAKHIFDPNTLTLGFARRFATYKRPNFLLHDPSRLMRILTNPSRPVQLIIAGKAHPADQPGQDLIKQWIQFIRRSEVRPHIIFLSDYDMLVTEHLVEGVDLWINTPRRPWEACGTSGMKVLVNGGINLSELDGWWAEAYTSEVGWALGDEKEHGEDPVWDAEEPNVLYDLLEQEVVPEFYTRDKEGIPTAWVARIRASMSQLAPHYSADRAVREYTDTHYLPAAINYHSRAKNQAELSKKLVDWQHLLEHKWNSLRFTEVKLETNDREHTFEIQVYVDELGPDAIKVELYADTPDDQMPFVKEMSRIRALSGDPNTYVYKASAPSSRPIKDYTPRIIPAFPSASVPLEASYILWHQ